MLKPYLTPSSNTDKMKPTITLLFLVAFTLLTSCQQTEAPKTESTTTETPQAQAPPPAIQAGMVKVAILYPNGVGKTFDMDYYSTKHMPMVAGLFGDAMKAMAIDKGMAGRTPEEPMPYLAVGYFYFNQLADYENAFGPNAEKILSDIPNYTNIQPVVQISEVVQAQ